MSEADEFLEDARRSFRLRADSTEIKSIEQYAAMA